MQGPAVLAAREMEAHWIIFFITSFLDLFIHLSIFPHPSGYG